MKRRIDRVRAAQSNYHPRVACFEWLDPLFVAGHWMPEMVEIAGGESGLIRKGEPSAHVEWQSVLEFAPEVIVLMPCGFDLKRTIEEAAALQKPDGWNDLPAVKEGNVYAVDGNAYFSRPGPRLIDGLELLARIVHPDERSRSLPADAVTRLPASI
jgi:iron complex transport system substrate-binding protein